MFYNEMEKIIEKQGLDGLIQLEFYYGMELELSRQTKTGPYSSVHGSDAGQPGKPVKTFIGILQGDDFFESNTTQTPAFVAGFLYTREDDILVGDTVKIVSKKERSRRYKVTAIDSIGLTREVFKRYKLSAMGDSK